MASVAANVVQQQKMPQFYRRPLPKTCVDFSSEEGKRLFVGALHEENLNVYFKLAAQFLTQEEPSFCGLSTLVMVLNALEVDPARVWKGAWRWYRETMLDCCVSLDVVVKIGITADHFECLARCNRLNVGRHNPPPVTELVSDEEKRRAIDEFRSTIRQTVRSESTVLVVSYCRKTFGQTGLGHFSPLAAYNAASDKVLIMDVARFKYPPHWVDVPLLWESMRELDPATNKPRGYFVLSLNENLKPMLLLRLIHPSTLKDMVGEMKRLFVECDTRFAGGELDVQKIVLTVAETVGTALGKFAILDLRIDFPSMEHEPNGICGKDSCKDSADKQVQTLIREVIDALENTTEFNHLMQSTGIDSIDGASDNGALDQTSRKRRALLAVGLFFSWPFERGNCSTCVLLAEYCQAAARKLPTTAQNEISSLKGQILALLDI